eukprot:gene30929-35985_t
MAIEGGTGAAATLTDGPLSLSAGHFLSRFGDTSQQHTVGQISYHSSHQLAASLVLSSTRRSLSTNTSDPLTSRRQQPLSCVGFLLPSPQPISASPTNSSPDSVTNQTSTSGSAVRLGLATSYTIGDEVVLTAWHMLKGGQALAGINPGGTGVRLATQPDSGGAVMALAVGRTNCEPEGRGVAKGGYARVYELSASIPTADGLCITSGLVVQQKHSGNSVGMVVNSTWRF